MSKIIIRIVTKEWTQGEYCAFHLKLREGSHATVDWGDGKSKRIPLGNGWHRFDHAYGKKGWYYTITIATEEDEGIIGFNGDCFYEVHTEDVDVSQCPELVYFGYSGGEDMRGEIDLTHNMQLKHIDWNGLLCKKLDFSYNTDLETVKIGSCPELISLNLSKNNKVWQLQVNFCTRLRRIAVSNLSDLRDVDLLFVCVDENSMTYLKKVVDANGGTLKSEEDDETFKP